MARSILALGLVVVPTLALAPAQAQTTWVVDPSGPLTTIQDAVDLAAEGDVVLVRPGEYPAFDVRDKGLSIHGEDTVIVRHFVVPPFLVFHDHALEVRDVPAGSTVVVRGIQFQLSYLEPYAAVVVQDDAGSVVFEDCTFVGSSSQAVRVTNSASVTFVRSVVGPGGPFNPNGTDTWIPSAGLRVQASNVHLFDTHVVGSVGHDVFGFTDVITSDGGAGLELDGGTVFASGSIITGGRGGQPDPIGLGPCVTLGDGGTALVVDEFFGPSRVVLFDSELVGGPGGAPLPGCNEPVGTTGPLQSVVAGDVVTLPGERRTFGFPSVLREQTSTECVYAGEPGDAVVLAIGARTSAPVFIEALALVGFVDPLGSVLSFRGSIGPSGVLFDAFAVPSLPGASTGMRVVTQAAFVDATGGLFASGPSHTVVVDAGL